MMTITTAYSIGDTVRLMPHYPGDVWHTAPWYIVGINATALDTGQSYTYYTVADQPRGVKMRQYLTGVRWDMLESWEEWP